MGLEDGGAAAAGPIAPSLGDTAAARMPCEIPICKIPEATTEEAAAGAAGAAAAAGAASAGAAAIAGPPELEAAPGVPAKVGKRPGAGRGTDEGTLWYGLDGGARPRKIP